MRLQELEKALRVKEAVFEEIIKKYKNFIFLYDDEYKDREPDFSLKLYRPIIEASDAIYVCRLSDPWEQPYPWVSILEELYTSNKQNEKIFKLDKKYACLQEFCGFWQGEERYRTLKLYPDLKNKNPNGWIKFNHCWDVLIEISLEKFFFISDYLVKHHQHDAEYEVMSNNTKNEYKWVRKIIMDSIDNNKASLFLTDPNIDYFTVRGKYDGLVNAWKFLTRKEVFLNCNYEQSLSPWVCNLGESIEDAAKRILNY